MLKFARLLVVCSAAGALAAGCTSGPPADDLSVGGLPDSVSPEARAIAKLTEQRCRAVFSLAQGDRDKSGLYFVSAFQEAGEQMQLNHFPSAAELEHFMLVNRRTLRNDENHVST